MHDLFRPAPPSPLYRAAGMATCRRDPHRDLIVYEVRGRATFRNLADAVESAIDLGLAEFALWNVTDGDLTGLLLGDIEDMVVQLLDGPWAPRKWAILTGVGPSLAVAGVFVDFAEDIGCCDRVKVFTRRESALDWLGIGEHPAPPAVPGAKLAAMLLR
ncbi:MAG: hypothetical protein JW751_21705 [Polyangiaceae bacterium]|nr:hypothetical protein [Polyangiaceae bacterium]